jgi:hypothetical protein
MNQLRYTVRHWYFRLRLRYLLWKLKRHNRKLVKLLGDELTPAIREATDRITRLADLLLKYEEEDDYAP